MRSCGRYWEFRIAPVWAHEPKLFEEGARVFEQARGTLRVAAGEGRKTESLEAKIQQKNEVLAERMGEHVAPKKRLASADGRVGPS